jgi:peptide/nickel transport system substrate-binding protein
VTYSDGQPFDSGSVVSVVGWLKSPAGRRTLMGSESRGIVGARAVNRYQVDIETKIPDPILPKRMSAIYMVEPQAWKQLGPDAFAQAPVGTGAFMVTDWDARRRRLTMSRNPRSWRTSTLERVTFVELPNGSARAQALLSQDVDIAFVDLEETPRLKRNGVRVLTTPSGQVKGFTFRVAGGDPKSPVQDVRVRQALNYAIDKAAISRSLLDAPPPSGQPASREAFGYDPTIPPYPYDPAKARALLAAAGYPKGFPLVLNVLKDTAPGDDMIAEEVAEYWRQVGVPTTLKVVTFPEHMRKYTTNSWTGDAFSISWNTYQYYDVTRPMEDFSCKRAHPFFCDQAITARLDAAKQIMDDKKRLVAYQALGRAYRDAAPTAFIIEHRDVIAFNPRIRDFRMRQRVPRFEVMHWAAP